MNRIELAEMADKVMENIDNMTQDEIKDAVATLSAEGYMAMASFDCFLGAVSEKIGHSEVRKLLARTDKEAAALTARELLGEASESPASVSMKHRKPSEKENAALFDIFG